MQTFEERAEAYMDGYRTACKIISTALESSIVEIEAEVRKGIAAERAGSEEAK